MKEIWQEIPGYEGYYEASTNGRIRSVPRIVSNFGGKHPVSKLTKSDVVEIKKMLSDGISQWKIAEKFGVAQTNISHINTGKSWREVA